MKITSSSSNNSVSAGANAAGAQRAGKAGDANGAVSNAQLVGTAVGEALGAGTAEADNPSVSLSAMAALHTSSDADIDTAKVESIKAALRDGTYQIDAGKIADGMLGSAREMLATRLQ